MIKISTNRLARSRQLQAIDYCLQYIFDNEYRDFEENPSESHIYYVALKALYGKSIADNILKQTIGGQNE